MDSDYKRLIFRLKARILDLEERVRFLLIDRSEQDQKILGLQVEISELQGMLAGFAERIGSLENVCFDGPPEPPNDEPKKEGLG